MPRTTSRIPKMSGRSGAVKPLAIDLFCGLGGWTEGLLAEEVPVFAGVAQKADWRLTSGTEPRGSDLVPLYRVFDPAGAQRGITEGLAVSSEQWIKAPPLRRIAGEAIPRIAALLTRIEAERR